MYPNPQIKIPRIGTQHRNERAARVLELIETATRKVTYPDSVIFIMSHTDVAVADGLDVEDARLVGNSVKTREDCFK